MIKNPNGTYQNGNHQKATDTMKNDPNQNRTNKNGVYHDDKDPNDPDKWERISTEIMITERIK